MDDSAEVSLIEMRWEEHWADVEFHDDGFGVEHLRARLMPAGAWCDVWPANTER